MGMPPRSLEQLNKTVVAFLDGRREWNDTHDFSPMRDSFNLLPAEDPLHAKGVKLMLKDLKAVFLVKDFVPNKDA
jgi:hypothetical protein